MLPYEIVNIAPENLGVMIRPYQWLLVLVTLALLARFALKRFPMQKFMPNVWDGLLIIFGASSFFSALASADRQTALKFSMILFSFILLYFLCRVFVRNLDDARMLLPFLFSSFLVIACYAILQNILFLGDLKSLEVMAGRPNATFAEADWLGGYLAIMLVAVSALSVSPPFIDRYSPFKLERRVFSVLMFLGFIALIISVSRSAWLSVFAGIASVFFLGFLKTQANRETGIAILRVIAPLLLALSAVYLLHLTTFDIFDRGQSVTSGKQKITIACARVVALPETISDVAELANYDCEHIRLEDIAAKETAGAYVTEIWRADPNVNTRWNIYKKVTGVLKEHWFFGIGFGMIADHLGTDGRGAGLNASNLFLEAWLGSGIVGFLAFAIFWFGLGWRWLSLGFQKHSSPAIALGSAWIAVTVFNLFNSGLFLGWFFVMLAFFLMAYQNDELSDSV